MNKTNKILNECNRMPLEESRKRTRYESWLEGIIQKYEIKSILDVPCGNWELMQHVDLSGVDYLGYDNSPKIIKGNNKFKSKSKKKGVVNFEVADITNKTDLGQFDLIICRDFLPQLTLGRAQKVLNNFKNSNSKYLISTSFEIGGNWELEEGEKMRHIDLQVEPFYLFDELESMQEPSYDGRFQKLWML